MAKVNLVVGVQLYPSARCDDEECGWTYPESVSARSAAKDHAKHKPGHFVIVETVKRDAYQLEGA